ncbi:transmembrane protein 163 [Nematostella vectensis]|uniref:transmembrane protein 163 n=1 Tax=Nematostella vectensis TaxID=45351 RepID=UPI0013905F64|nr:transmembrane protein 163 [Nematostella vectensis]
MASDTKYGSTVLLTDVRAEERAHVHDDCEPCVSALHDDNSLQKEKLPPQLAAKWRRIAIVLSIASLFCTLVLGIAALVVSSLANSSAAFGFAYDSLLDALTTLVVLWRFLGGTNAVYSAERERKACKIIGVCFVVSSIGILTRAVRSLIVERHPQQFSGLEAISGISLVILSLLAWMKFVVADRIRSSSLKTDGINSTAGAAMSLGMIMSSLAYDHNNSVWFLDAAIAICTAVAIGVYGIRLLIDVYQTRSQYAESDGNDD